MGILVVVFVFFIAFFMYRSYKKKSQLAFIERYEFPSAIGKKVQETYPHLSSDQVDQVLSALRDYFYICHKAGGRMVSMPSQAVDVAWHEFILFTRSYQTFCKKGLGRFLHHTPSEAMRSKTSAQEGIKRAWRLACDKRNISPNSPTTMPLLFAIDANLNIEDGFKYVLDCKDKASPLYGSGYCATHIGCASGCSGDSGNFDEVSDFGSSDSSCSGGCGGGD